MAVEFISTTLLEPPLYDAQWVELPALRPHPLYNLHSGEYSWRDTRVLM